MTNGISVNKPLVIINEKIEPSSFPNLITPSEILKWKLIHECKYNTDSKITIESLPRENMIKIALINNKGNLLFEVKKEILNQINKEEIKNISEHIFKEGDIGLDSTKFFNELERKPNGNLNKKVHCIKKTDKLSEISNNPNSNSGKGKYENKYNAQVTNKEKSPSNIVSNDKHNKPKILKKITVNKIDNVIKEETQSKKIDVNDKSEIRMKESNEDDTRNLLAIINSEARIENEIKPLTDQIIVKAHHNDSIEILTPLLNTLGNMAENHTNFNNNNLPEDGEIIPLGIRDTYEGSEGETKNDDFDIVMLSGNLY